jgi:hypothetical protein
MDRALGQTLTGGAIPTWDKGVTVIGAPGENVFSPLIRIFERNGAHLLAVHPPERAGEFAAIDETTLTTFLEGGHPSLFGEHSAVDSQWHYLRIRNRPFTEDDMRADVTFEEVSVGDVKSLVSRFDLSDQEQIGMPRISRAFVLRHLGKPVGIGILRDTFGSPGLTDPGVAVFETDRGRNFGKEIIRRLSMEMVESQGFMLYAHDESNRSSEGIARSLGFDFYARHKWVVPR